MQICRPIYSATERHVFQLRRHHGPLDLVQVPAFRQETPPVVPAGRGVVVQSWCLVCRAQLVEVGNDVGASRNLLAGGDQQVDAALQVLDWHQH